MRFTCEGLPISCSHGNCWQSTSLYQHSIALDAWRCVGGAPLRSVASMVKKGFNLRLPHFFGMAQRDVGHTTCFTLILR